MAKRKKSRKPGTHGTQQRMLNQDEINIAREAEHVIRLAQNHDSRVVTLGSLVFFSTATGDAWMLNPADKLALCLARDGDKQPFTITETPSSFAIEWKAHYQFDGDAFVVAENFGRTRTILGYPTAHISEAVGRVT